MRALLGGICRLVSETFRGVWIGDGPADIRAFCMSCGKSLLQYFCAYSICVATG
jgi:hypothetical protein